MKASWKTTTLGILGIVVLIINVATSWIGNGFASVEWGVVLPALFAAVTGLFARDDDKSSEDVKAGGTL